MTSGRFIGIWSGVILVLGLCFFLPARGHAAPVFTKVADTSTVMPGGSGTFTALGTPSISQGAVAFYGYRDLNNTGIYSTVGGSLGVIADETTQIPFFGPEKFRSFGTRPSISEGAVSFRGSGVSDSGITGVYTAYEYEGSMEVFSVIDHTSLGGTYSSFGDPSATGGPMDTGGTVAFRARNVSTDVDSVKARRGGSVWNVAAQYTNIPGGSGTFERFYDPSSSGDQVVFWGAAGTDQEGIYLYTLGGAREVVADVNTAIPGGTGDFTNFSLGPGGRPSISEGNISFYGFGDYDSGVYSVIGGSLGVVADENTLIPGSAETFRYFTDPVISGDTTAFGASDAASNWGIYVSLDGELRSVIEVGDTLDGKTISELLFGPGGFDGLDIAFRASFTDGSSGIYVGSPVPEPGTALLLAFGLAGLATAGRRRSVS
jgi:hypothetical protein